MNILRKILAWRRDRRFGKFVADNPAFAKAFVFRCGSGLSDQLRMLGFARKACNPGTGTTAIFDLRGLGVDIPPGLRLYDFEEIRGAAGKFVRRLKDEKRARKAETPFELHKYKIDWSFAKFANLPKSVRGVFGERAARLGPHSFGGLAEESGGRVRLEADGRAWGFSAPFYFCGTLRPSDSDAEFMETLEAAFDLDAANAAMLARIEAAENPVCLHLRRGDFRHTSHYREIAAAQVAEALAGICAGADGKGKPSTIFCFSDDWAWAEPLINSIDFGGVRFELAKGNGIGDPASELELMRKCRHFIASNGNFCLTAFQMCRDREKTFARL